MTPESTLPAGTRLSKVNSHALTWRERARGSASSGSEPGSHRTAPGSALTEQRYRGSRTNATLSPDPPNVGSARARAGSGRRVFRVSKLTSSRKQDNTCGLPRTARAQSACMLGLTAEEAGTPRDSDPHSGCSRKQDTHPCCTVKLHERSGSAP